MSCAVVGSLGTCTAVTAGKGDPAGRCPDQGAASCGTNGFCDGAGACQRYGAGVECAPPTCPTTGTTATLARTCDGAGVCMAATTQSCAPYACNGTTCFAACGGNSDCAAPNVCNSGACGKKRLGQQCLAGTECESGNCVDGVCCGSSSCGTCFSCAVSGKAGSCQPVPAGETDAMNRCTSGLECGYTGLCDGAGACQYAPTSTSCGVASCTGAIFTPVGNCDGAGLCKRTPTGCGRYVCGSNNACLTTCTKNEDCIAGDTCQSGSCTNLKPLGTACVAGAECLSGACTEGYCCDATACGKCRSCARPGNLGTCTAVAAGNPDPVGMCMAMSVSTCGTTGACDGSGECASYPTGTTCQPSTCPAGSALRTDWKCSGGSCISSQVDCLTYMCDSTLNTCRAACTVPEDCVAPATCTSGLCQQ